MSEKKWTLTDKAALDALQMPQLTDIFRMVIKALPNEEAEGFLNDYRNLVLRNKPIDLAYYIQKLSELPITE